MQHCRSPAANLRGPPDKYGLVTVRRPSVRCTPRSGSGVLCSAARFVSAKKATMAARGSRAYFFDLFRMRRAARQSAATSMAGFLVNCSSAAVQLQKKYATVWVLSRICRPQEEPLCWKGKSSHLLRVLQQKGIYTYLVRIQNFFFIFRLTMKTFFTFRTE